MEGHKNSISFKTGRRDFVERGQFKLFVFLAFFIWLFIMADGIQKKLIALSFVVLILFVLFKSSQKVIFEYQKVFKMNYFGQKKVVCPVRIFVAKLDTGNRFFLEYENDKKKKKKLFLSGEPEDFKELYEEYREIILFSKKFKALVGV